MKKSLLSQIKTFLSYLKPYKKEASLALIALIVSSLAILIFSYMIKALIDEGLFLAKKDFFDSNLIKTFLVILTLGFATALRFFLITSLGEKLLADLRREIHNKILSLSPSFFENHKAGDLLAQLSSDTTTIYDIVSSSLSVLMRNSLMLIGGIILLISNSLKLTLLIFMVIPILVLVVIIMGRETKKLGRDAQDKVSELTSLTDEVLNNIKTIQAYCQEDFEKSKFSNKLEETLQISLKRITSRAFLTFILIVGVFATIGLVLFIGTGDVVAGQLTKGELSSFLFLTILCGASFIALSETLNSIQKASGVSERISEFLSQKPEIFNEVNSVKLNEIKVYQSEELYQAKGDLIFDKVTFCYPAKPEIPAIKNFSAKFESGKTTALVGESGSGKSSIFQLILRFYKISTGHILYHGLDYSKIDLKDLRNEFAYLGQDPAIFSASIFDNIAYSKPDATEAEVRKAAELSAALEFIEKLPKKFETFVGEKGVRLSGGQKQRIALARAFLKNPNLLLLDEATSALDSHNEKLVQEGLNSLSKGRTTIVIAHRLSTIEKADKILVMQEGKLVEEGKHEDLMEKKGYYYQLYSKK
jgi:ATP-binding cassette subfamily B protein